jgi:hypothetical protein
MKRSDGLETEKLVEKLASSESIDDYLDAFGEQCAETFSFSECFHALFVKKNLKKMEVLDRSQIERVYGHEIIRGKRNPSRDKVLMMSFGMLLTVPETQLLLRHSGHNPLTPKIRRDAVILFALAHGVNLIDMNELLVDKDLQELA